MPNIRSRKAPHLPVKKKRNRNTLTEEKSSPSKTATKKTVQQSSDNESITSPKPSKKASLGQNTSPIKNQTLKKSSVSPSKNLNLTNNHNQNSLNQNTLSTSNNRRSSKKKKLDLPSLNELDPPPRKRPRLKRKIANNSSADVQDTSTLKTATNQDVSHDQNQTPTKRKLKQIPSSKHKILPKNRSSQLKRKLKEHTSDDHEPIPPSENSCSLKKIVQEKVQSKEPTNTIDLTQSTTNNDLKTDKDINPSTIKICQVSNTANQSVQILNKGKFITLPTNLTNIPKLRMVPSMPETAKRDKNQMASEKTVDIDNHSTSTPQTLQSVSSIDQISLDKVPPLVPLKKTSQASVMTKTKDRPKRSPKKSPQKLTSPSKRMPQTKSSELPKVRIEVKRISKLNEELGGRRRRPDKKTRKKDDGEPSTTSTKIEYTYIADGLKEDCQNLVEKCLQVYKLNFQKFCEIWKEMDFPLVFYGRQSGAEIAEFSEEAIHVAKAHMLAKNVNFEENVAGLFLVYAFLNHQPYKDFAALRLVPSDVPAVLHLENEARKQRRNDVLYILGSVLIKGPCQYHVLPREVALDMPYRKYYDGSVQQSGRTIKGVLTKRAECVQQFKEVISLDQKYAAIRKKINEKNGGIDCIRNLSTQPAAQLFHMYIDHIPGEETDDPHAEPSLTKSRTSVAEEENRHDLVRSIKHRAMTNVVDAMRHLQGVDERQHDSTISSTGSETETVSPRKSSPRIKGKGKGKGRYSAQALHNLFVQDAVDKELPPAPSQREMPTLDMTDGFVTEIPEPVTAPEIGSSLAIINEKSPNKPHDSVTVTLETITIPDDAPSLVDGEPPNKLVKRNNNYSKEENIADDIPIKKSAENLVEPAKKDKTIKRRYDPNSDFDKIDTLEELDKIQGSCDKSENLNLGKRKTNKEKEIKIKNVQIIKPANDSNADEVVGCEKEINIQSDLTPVKNDNIKTIIPAKDSNAEEVVGCQKEINIASDVVPIKIDNLKITKSTNDSNANIEVDPEKEIKLKSDLIPVKSDNKQIIKPAKDSKNEVVSCEKEIIQFDSILVEIDTANKHIQINTIDEPSTILDNDKTVLSTTNVKTRNGRKKRKQSIKTKETVEAPDDSSSDESAVIAKDSIKDSVEKTKSKLGRRHLKRCRMKSTLKKMGLLEVADFEVTDKSG